MEPQKPTSDYLDYHNKVDSGLFKIPKEILSRLPKKYYLDHRDKVDSDLFKIQMQTNDEPKEKAFSFRVDTTGLKQVHRDG